MHKLIFEEGCRRLFSLPLYLTGEYGRSRRLYHYEKKKYNDFNYSVSGFGKWYGFILQ